MNVPKLAGVPPDGIGGLPREGEAIAADNGTWVYRSGVIPGVGAPASGKLHHYALSFACASLCA